MTLKHFAGLNLTKRFLLIATLAVAIIAAISVVPEMQRMVPPAHASNPAGLDGSFVVQASGTAYFYTPTGTTGTTEVLHYTMAGSATFSKDKNTAVNLTLNLGGEDDYSSQGEYDELICYLTAPGDLFYTPGSGSTPAMLTVTYQSGDTCGNPAGIGNTGIGPGNGGVSESNNGLGKQIPFNFYPTFPKGGLIISNYTYLTLGGNVGGSYPNAWSDSGSSYAGVPNAYSHPIYGMSVTGQLTPAVP